MKKYAIFLVGLLLFGSVADASLRPSTLDNLSIGDPTNAPGPASWLPDSGDLFVDGVLYADLLTRTNYFKEQSFSPLEIWVDQDGTLFAPTLNVVDGANLYQRMLPADTVHKLLLQTCIPSSVATTPSVELILYGYMDYPIATGNYAEIDFSFNKQQAGVTPDITGFTGTPVSINNDITTIQAVTLDIDAVTSTWNVGDTIQLKAWMNANGGTTTENFRVTSAKFRIQEK